MVKRLVSTDVGFLGSPVVKETLKEQSPTCGQADLDLTVIGEDHGDRLATTYPGSKRELHKVLARAFHEMPDILVGDVRETCVLPRDTEDHVVAVVPSAELRRTLVDERLLIFGMAGASWFGKTEASRMPHVEVYRTPDMAEATEMADALADALQNGGRTALVLGEPYVVSS